jgi:hypothetical protein
MSKAPAPKAEPLLVRLSRTRLDLAIATGVLLAFFFYRGGLRLVATLVILFVLFVGVFRLASAIRHWRRSGTHPDSLQDGEENAPKPQSSD